MNMNAEWQGRYLDCLRTKRQVPTLEYLRSLVKSHLHRIPFENVSKFHYYLHQSQAGLQWLPSPETFLHHVALRGWGGNCYILNAYFGELLRSLGYQADIVRATGGNTHLALMVTLDGQAYYVDVGYGAPLFEPISLEEQPRFTRYGEEVEITKLDAYHYMIDRRVNGQSFVTKCIEWRPVDLDSFDEVITHSLRDADDNPFMRRIVSTLYKPDVCYSVINHKLFVKTEQGTEVHEYTRKRDWMDMMSKTFGFDDEGLEQAVGFLGERGVSLF